MRRLRLAQSLLALLLLAAGVPLTHARSSGITADEYPPTLAREDHSHSELLRWLEDGTTTIIVLAGSISLRPGVCPVVLRRNVSLHGSKDVAALLDVRAAATPASCGTALVLLGPGVELRLQGITMVVPGKR